MNEYNSTPPGLGHFLCGQDDLAQRLKGIDVQAYARTRNYLDGAVTWLSPFLSHGILDTVDVANAVLADHSPKRCCRLLYELAWREYFHRVWQRDGHAIFSDLKHAQAHVQSRQVPRALLDADTGLRVIDAALKHLFTQGTLHNHARMWIASLACNVANTAWYEPARWLHFHLLDGDLASNTLSWQWVAGTFSHQRYLANQQNIDKYSRQHQSRSWLDLSYAALDMLDRVPPALTERAPAELPVTSPASKPVGSVAAWRGTVALRSLWNLDPRWHDDIAQQVLFIDTDWLQRWPMADHRWRFVEHWAGQVPGLVMVHGTVEALRQSMRHAEVVIREYPACEHWPGVRTPRRWLFDAPGQSFESFSQFWKQVRGDVAL